MGYLHLLGAILAAGPGISSPVSAAPARFAGAQNVPAGAIFNRDADARIAYPPGHYPQLRMANGESHAVHSLLKVTRPLAFGDYIWNDAGVSPGPVWVRIDLARQMLSVFRGGDEIGTTLVIYGATNKPTPPGIFHILQKSQYYYSHTYNASMPYALRLTTDGVALHASTVRERRATHGCIGLPAEFARLLFNAASQGDEVEIVTGSRRS